MPSRPVVSASTSAPQEPSKPAAEDRIGKVGTTYEPVKLATPGKLGNRWNPAAQQTGEDDEPAAPVMSMKERMAAFNKPAATESAPQPSGKKLTWAERQAEAKRQQEEEEARSSAAIANGELLMSAISADSQFPSLLAHSRGRRSVQPRLCLPSSLHPPLLRKHLLLLQPRRRLHHLHPQLLSRLLPTALFLLAQLTLRTKMRTTKTGKRPLRLPCRLARSPPLRRPPRLPLPHRLLLRRHLPLHHPALVLTQ